MHMLYTLYLNLNLNDGAAVLRLGDLLTKNCISSKSPRILWIYIHMYIQSAWVHLDIEYSNTYIYANASAYIHTYVCSIHILYMYAGLYKHTFLFIFCL